MFRWLFRFHLSLLCTIFVFSFLSISFRFSAYFYVNDECSVAIARTQQQQHTHTKWKWIWKGNKNAYFGDLISHNTVININRKRIDFGIIIIFSSAGTFYYNVCCWFFFLHWSHHQRWHCLFDQKLCDSFLFCMLLTIVVFVFTLCVLENWIYNYNSQRKWHSCEMPFLSQLLVIYYYFLLFAFWASMRRNMGWKCWRLVLMWTLNIITVLQIHLMKMCLAPLSFPYLSDILLRFDFALSPAPVST